ncbi:MAG: AAA family ATPase [Rhizomicrobium sp.]
MEKAHPDLFNILLQVMDHGKLTDHNGKKIDFRNVVLIMTTNAGASDAAKDAIGFGRGKRDGEDEEAIKKLFTPEFRNRLDATITFAPLGRDNTIDRVVEKFVLELEAQLTDRDVTFDLTPEATRWLGEKGYDDAFGARPLARVIQENLKKPLADEILFGKLKDGGHGARSAGSRRRQAGLRVHHGKRKEAEGPPAAEKSRRRRRASEVTLPLREGRNLRSKFRGGVRRHSVGLMVCAGAI